MPLALAAFAVACAATGAQAACETRPWEGRSHLVCAFPQNADVRLFLAGPDGVPFGTFTAVNSALAARGERLAFAMNAGMYSPDYMPVGLYVEGGRQLKAANQRAGAGNFHLKPNGIFYVTRDGRAGVVETGRFLARKIAPVHATQSGPMLVIDNQLHPRFREESDSLKIRNGVGVCADGRIRFAISNEPVSFHDFATLFRDALKCPDALYLDGSISSVYAPSVGRHDRWRPMGPIVGVVEKGR